MSLKLAEENVKAPATSPPLAIAKPPDAVATGPGSGVGPLDDEDFAELELTELILLEATDELDTVLVLELTATLELDEELDTFEELELTATLDELEATLELELDEATELELGAIEELLDATFELELTAATELELVATELEVATAELLLEAAFELELAAKLEEDATELELGAIEELEATFELELELDGTLELAGALDAIEEALELAGSTTSTDDLLELLTTLELLARLKLASDDLTELDVACTLDAATELLITAAEDAELTTADDTAALDELLGIGELSLPVEPPEPPQAERTRHSKPVDITLICMRHSHNQ